jgi:fucose permease
LQTTQNGTFIYRRRIFFFAAADMETSCLLYALIVVIVIIAIYNAYINMESDDLNDLMANVTNTSTLMRSLRRRSWWLDLNSREIWIYVSVEIICFSEFVAYITNKPNMHVEYQQLMSLLLAW